MMPAVQPSVHDAFVRRWITETKDDISPTVVHATQFALSGFGRGGFNAAVAGTQLCGPDEADLNPRMVYLCEQRDQFLPGLLF